VLVVGCSDLFPHLGAQRYKQNAFSEKLSHTGFNLFMMLVVDLLHEFELGVWKAIFIHLLRILETLKQSQISDMDKR